MRGVGGPDAAEAGDAGIENPCTGDIGRLLGLVGPETFGDSDGVGRRRDAQDFLKGGGAALAVGFGDGGSCTS